MKRLFFFCLCFAVVFLGCTGKNSVPPVSEEGIMGEAVPQEKSGWYYFSNTGIHEAKNPAEIPQRPFRPWTEAVRVSDAAIIQGVPAFLINRLGIMTSGSPDTPPALHTAAEFFESNTAAGFLTSAGETAIHFYKSSFFSEKNGKSSGSVILAGYKTSDGSFAAELTAPDIGLAAGSQCVALDKIGSRWYAAFKLEEDNKVDFTYLEFELVPCPEEIPNIYSVSGIKKLSTEAYRNSVKPFDFSQAPVQLRNLLSRIPDETAFSLRVYSPDLETTQTFTSPGISASVEGSAFFSEEKTAVLFADGTFYYSPNIAEGKRYILRLPVLSNGYVYTNFILTGDRLLAAWEEQRFFETGRTGLLEIKIPDGIQ
ncbi:hypothetical protein K7I13_04445 [Brucepastera parasyntrophica]|uniref:hypothetical protein n=1 Tax=Brucepastera parasyntrophica TaxID=2880008 RepID=UPI00210D6C4D|nr:hypothetical protein [Brucepastera parasyntrophica]ULQ60547.1 hypothetical protein K7I13_04445 [Brucepastera parasyntrophica]